MGPAIFHAGKGLSSFAFGANQPVVAKLEYLVKAGIVIGVSGSKLGYGELFHINALLCFTFDAKKFTAFFALSEPDSPIVNV